MEPGEQISLQEGSTDLIWPSMADHRAPVMGSSVNKQTAIISG